MKKMKKVIACLAAAVMAVSSAALVACGPGEEPGSPDGTIQIKNVHAAKTLTAVGSQTFADASVSFNMTRRSARSVPSAEGQTANSDGFYDYSNKTLSGSGSVDLPGAALDFFYNETATYEGDDSEYDYNYAESTFLRNGDMVYAYMDGKNVTDWTGVELYRESIVSLNPAYEDGINFGSYYGNLAGETATGTFGMKYATAVLISLGDSYDAITYENGKLKIDYNKTAYGLYSQAKSEVAKFNANTKFSTILSNDIIKKLIGSVMYGLDAKTMYDLYLEQLQSGEFGPRAATGRAGNISAAELINAVPVPAQGQSVYSYLSTVLNDSNFYKLLSPVPGKNTYGEVTLGEFLSFVAPSVDQSTIPAMLAQMIDRYVTATASKLTVKADSTVEVSGAVVTFELASDYKIKAIEAKADIVETYESYSYDSEDNETTETTRRTMSASGSIRLGSAPALKNLAGAKVLISNYGRTGVLYARPDEPEADGFPYLKLTLTDGRLTDLKVTSEFCGGTESGTYDSAERTLTVGDKTYGVYFSVSDAFEEDYCFVSLSLDDPESYSYIYYRAYKLKGTLTA